MEINKILDSDSIDVVADNIFGAVNNSVSEAREIQRKKVAENVQLVVDALKKIEQDIIEKYDDIGSQLEKRITSIKDGKDGINGKDGRDGKDGKPGKDGKAGKNGIDGRSGLDGVDGKDGVSVVDAHIDFDGSLIIHLSTGKEINVGEVVAPDVAEKIKVITNGGGTSQEVIDTLASLQSQIDSLIPSQTGNAGKFLTTNGTSLSWGLAVGGLSYQGTWNASTNTPSLASGTGTNGYYYIVGVAGSTDLDGITDWQVGDWLLFNGSVWQKLDQTNLVTSVNSYTGAVTLTASDVGAATSAQGALADSALQNIVEDTSPQLGGILDANGYSFSGPLNGTVGATTPASGAFTTLSASGNVTLSGGTANGVVYLNGSKVQTSGIDLQFDGTNLGLGVTPSAWNPYTAIELSGYAAIASYAGFTGVSNNWYYASGDKYIGNDYATLLSQYDGKFVFYNAPSGTAGNAITWTQAMTLDASGNLGIGVTSMSYPLDVKLANNQFILARESASLITNGFRIGGPNNESKAVFSANSATGEVNLGAINNNYFLTFSTNGANERARIDSSGNFGIGVTPSAWQTTASSRALQFNGSAIYGYRDSGLYLQQNAYFDGAWKYYATGAAGRYALEGNKHTWAVAASGSANAALTWVDAMTLDASGNLCVGAAATAGSSRAIISGNTRQLALSDGTYNWYQVIGNNYWSIQSGDGTECARIDSSGNLLIGTTDTGYKLNVVAASGYCAIFNASSGNTTLVVANATGGSQTYARFYASATQTGAITTDGTNTSYVTTSDYRLKEAVQPMTNALAVVTQLNPVTYNWKVDGSQGQGFIAHELQAVVPDCVTGEKDAVDADGKPVYQGIDTSFLVATLTAAIKELKAENDSLKARLDAAGL